MRAAFGMIHRWAGLVTAAFLFFSGVTGAVISWDHALDEWLNSRLTSAKPSGPARPSTELAKLIEDRDPRVRVTYLVTTPEAGDSLSFFVEPGLDPATGKRFELNYNQVFLDPATGE